MAKRKTPPLAPPVPLPALPKWAQGGTALTHEQIAFRFGGLLATLDLVLANPSVPRGLLASKLALRAAEASLRIEGRITQPAVIRDAYYLTPPGDALGPDGDAFGLWRDAGRFPLSGKADRMHLPDHPVFSAAPDAQNWGDEALSRGLARDPIEGAVHAMRLCLRADPRAERLACLLSDMVIARAARWNTPLPLTALYLTKTLLREIDSDEGALKVKARLLDSLAECHRLARDLAERADALRRVAPKLRAKSSDAAVDLFLREDAVLPSAMLAPVVRGTKVKMTDRAARRFCDRLVELGVARELTGRSTFRLYGIAP